MTTLTHRLRAIVGPAHVLTEGDLTAWEQEWRQRGRGKALAVVRPSDAQQVAAVVKACAAAGTSIVPQGGNTGLAVGSIPDGSGTHAQGTAVFAWFFLKDPLPARTKNRIRERILTPAPPVRKLEAIA